MVHIWIKKILLSGQYWRRVNKIIFEFINLCCDRIFFLVAMDQTLSHIKQDFFYISLAGNVEKSGKNVHINCDHVLSKVQLYMKPIAQKLQWLLLSPNFSKEKRLVPLPYNVHVIYNYYVFINFYFITVIVFLKNIHLTKITLTNVKMNILC